MPPMSADFLPLQAGVEHELVFTSEAFTKVLEGFEGHRGQVIMAGRKWIAGILQVVESITVDSDIKETKMRATPEVYKSKWTLPMEEGLVPEENFPKRPPFDLELASPVSNINDEGWIKQTYDIYAVLSKDYKIDIEAPPETCATHVHISPSKEEWNLDHLKAVSRAIVYYERCIDGIVHEDHLNSSACIGSNFASVLYQSEVSNRSDWKSTWENNMALTIQTLYARINTCKSKHDLVTLMCSFVKGSKASDGNPRKSNELSRSFRWNFRPLIDESKAETQRVEGYTGILGTIEFKQPEGSSTAERAIAWRLFASGFVQAAILEDFSKTFDGNEPPSVDSLQDFVEGGIEDKGTHFGLVLETIFECKNGELPTKIHFTDANGFEEYAVERQGSPESSIHGSDPDVYRASLGGPGVFEAMVEPSDG